MRLPKDIGFVSMWCLDLPAQRALFVQTLGAQVEYEDANAVVLGGSSAQVVLRRADWHNGHLAGSSHVGYFVDHLDQWMIHLAAQGVRIEVAGADVGQGRRAVVFRTPAGQFLTLIGR